MKPIFIVIFSFIFLFLGLDIHANSFFERYEIKSPIVINNLTLFPVMVKGQILLKKNYLLLDEGLLKKLVIVKEITSPDSSQINPTPSRNNRFQQRVQYRRGGPQVNQVLVSNLSDRPLYLMGGEVILGGQQDRVVQKDVLIPPKTESVRVAVFCVEKGRWSGQTMQFQSANNVTHMKLRQKAMFENQQSVWDEVAKNNKQMKTGSQTDTYQAVIKDATLNQKLAPQLLYIERALAGLKGIAGIIVGIDGKVVAMDVFYAAPLFAKVKVKLLKSYALEAISKPKPINKGCSQIEAVQFIKEAEKTTINRVETDVKSPGKRAYIKAKNIDGVYFDDGGDRLHYNIIKK